MPDGRGSGDDDSDPGRPHPTDYTLDTAVERARKGDEDAFRHLYRAVQPRLLNYLRALVGHADAEDVASDTWTRIARDMRSFRGAGDEFRAWAATIAHHRAVDHLRRRRPGNPLPIEDMPHRAASNDTEREAVESISTASALALIADLPPDQAQAILLRVVIGLNAPSAGKILGKRPDAIRAAAHRGLRNLARRLQPAAKDNSDYSRRPSRCTVALPSPANTLGEAT
ncbi:sigma-70 family RNA polymerase sigma factor [Streptomyces sp. NPDC001817]|uniref:RNA polymerase sigma factor n=1 Tax=Streptomyces sp. NPDC001817 TaxID=3154398 RepID=UPI00331A55E4